MKTEKKKPTARKMPPVYKHNVQVEFVVGAGRFKDRLKSAWHLLRGWNYLVPVVLHTKHSPGTDPAGQATVLIVPEKPVAKTMIDDENKLEQDPDLMKHLEAAASKLGGKLKVDGPPVDKSKIPPKEGL